jgi:hypothetical protein
MPGIIPTNIEVVQALKPVKSGLCRSAATSERTAQHARGTDPLRPKRRLEDGSYPLSERQELLRVFCPTIDQDLVVKMRPGRMA